MQKVIMAARIINGTELAGRIRDDTAEKVKQLRNRGVRVLLDTILVGNPEGGVIYTRSQEKRCHKVGIEFRRHDLDESANDVQVQELVTRLSADPQVTGILLNLPLPDHIDTPAAQYAIDPYKDIEGVNPANVGLLFYGSPIIAPCTAQAVMAILDETGISVRGKHAVVVGQGNVAGKPIALALTCAEATVTSCNEHTEDLALHTRMADILIAAAGVPELIHREHVKPGAVVIDVGINTVAAADGDSTETRVVGDVKFDEGCEVASAITPVPGGVGPVTVAILLHSVVEAATKQRSSRRIPGAKGKKVSG